jgi:DNA gyrase subunit A
VIENAAEIVLKEKKIEETNVIFLMDRFGYAKTIDVSTFERNHEAAMAENKYVFTCKNTDKICMFTNTGQMHLIKVLDLPFGKFRDKGTPIDNVSNYDSSKESICYLTSLGKLKDKTMVFGSSDGMIKLVEGKEFDVSKKTTAATKLNEGAQLLLAQELYGGETIVLRTVKNMFLRILSFDIPQKKKGAIGVRGIRLAPTDSVKEYYILAEGDTPVVEVSGKELNLSRLKIGNRDTKGSKH